VEVTEGPEVRQFVLKIHGRCNLACDYCYVYEAVDQSWRSKPPVMSLATARTVGARIREYAERHGLLRVGVTLHGGEPLLAGLNHLRGLVDALRAAVGGETLLDIGLQTNGILLSEAFADYFLAQHVAVGVSLDGGQAAHDRHRRFSHGDGSYEQVLRSVRLLTSPSYRPIFSGLLATIDPANDPTQLFLDLLEVDPGRVDLLLPHATWDNPPPAADPDRTVYGDWLVTFFDLWYEAPPRMGVRLFQETMHTLLGGASSSEVAGLSSHGSLVVETDGSFERSDVLKVAFPGAPATESDVFRHSVNDVLALPEVRAFMRRGEGLSSTCRSCPILPACGGGIFAHRYRSSNGFDNPSVYCRDLGRLITHISRRIRADLAARQSGTVASAHRDSLRETSRPGSPGLHR
jgi:uncharacterized protein